MAQGYGMGAQAWAYDQNGNLLWSGNNGGYGGWGGLYSQAMQQGAPLAAQNTANRLGAIDPTTGLPKNGTMPTTQADYQYIQQQLNQNANQQGNNIYNQQMGLLGYKPGAMNGTGQTLGGAAFNPNAISPNAPSSAGGAGGGASMPPGSMNAGTSATGAGSWPMPTVDPKLQSGFSSALLNTITNPGYSGAQVQDMKNNASDSLSGAQAEALRQGQQQAAASGFGTSGGMLAGQNAIHSDYANQISNAQRGIDLSAAQEKQQAQQAALNTGASYLGTQQKTLQDWYQWQASQQIHDRDLALGLMGQQKPTVPNVAGGGVNPASLMPNGFGFGGGANSGPFGAQGGGGQFGQQGGQNKNPFQFTGSNGGGGFGFGGTPAEQTGQSGWATGGTPYQSFSNGNSGGGDPSSGMDPFGGSYNSRKTAAPRSTRTPAPFMFNPAA